MPKEQITGEEGEAIAADYLISKGYKIIERNWRYYKLELDIIADKDNLLIVVEVKSRYTDAYGEPETFIRPAKQKKIIKAADAFIKLKNLDTEVRFDVISITGPACHFRLKHIRNAFYPVL